VTGGIGDTLRFVGSVSGSVRAMWRPQFGLGATVGSVLWANGDFSRRQNWAKLQGREGRVAGKVSKLFPPLTNSLNHLAEGARLRLLVARAVGLSSRPLALYNGSREFLYKRLLVGTDERVFSHSTRLDSRGEASLLSRSRRTSAARSSSLADWCAGPIQVGGPTDAGSVLFGLAGCRVRIRAGRWRSRPTGRTGETEEGEPPA